MQGKKGKITDKDRFVSSSKIQKEEHRKVKNCKRKIIQSLKRIIQHHQGSVTVSGSLLSPTQLMPAWPAETLQVPYWKL